MTTGPVTARPAPHGGVLLSVLCLMACWLVGPDQASAREVWTPEQAQEWYRQQPWLVGVDYLPRTAINQLEMWQEETFAPTVIDEEFGWAEQIGLNTVRVSLHDLPWDQDSAGYLARIDRFLSIAEKHKIRVIFVFFDSCWDPQPLPGRQRDPEPRVHNSGWVQSPGAAILNDQHRHDLLAPYVSGVVKHFRTDPRVLLWDVFNEPENTGGPITYREKESPVKAELALMLLQKATAWILAQDPEQPVSTGIWHQWGAALDNQKPIPRFSLTHSDVITFHAFVDARTMTTIINALSRYRRPMICTEYLARDRKCTLLEVTPVLHAAGVGAINWGFVDGKSQTKFPWDSWSRNSGHQEPSPWFHDLLHSDGTPYDPAEIELLKRLIGTPRQ